MSGMVASDWRHAIRYVDIEEGVERTPEVEAWLEETNRRLARQLQDMALYGHSTVEAREFPGIAQYYANLSNPPVIGVDTANGGTVD